MGGVYIKGRIIKGIGGFYYVRDDAGKIYECRAKGIFRNEGVRPIPGDFVRFTAPTETAGGSIDEILPRKNELPRPLVANIDLLLVVVSAKKPKPDFMLVDKLLIYAMYYGIAAAIGMNKMDQAADETESLLIDYAKSGATLLYFSAEEKTGLSEVEALLQNKTTCLAGQSAVGKSSLLNALEPSLLLETGGLTRKTGRGRHTTRHSEFILLEKMNVMVVDTPGFSILEAIDIEPEELRDYYPEFAEATCRFDMCTHDKEPECGVKNLVEAGEIPLPRYERYIKILHELIERRDTKYA
ncbi:MAG: ribosome small subunit-dependent GTPase A [Christensenellaceae bacterium]|jgi:ribosome biogenesis GTPase